MADVKISQLTALASASSDVAADVLAIVDTSVPQTKKITIENLVSPITLDKSNSRIGIGATSPTHKLTVEVDATDGGTGNDGQLALRGATNTNLRLMMGMDTSNEYGFISPMKLGTSWNNLSLCYNGGNVGIGDNAPATKLDVNGDIQIQGANALLLNHTTGAASDTYINSPSSNNMGFRTGGTLAMTIDSSQDIRMSELLYVNNAVNHGRTTAGATFRAANNGNAAITLLSASNHSAGVGQDIVALNFAANNEWSTTKDGVYGQIRCENGDGSYADRGQLVFATGYNGNTINDRMYIHSNGNVSIGSDSNGDKLYISDGASAFAAADRMIQLKRNATNGNNTTSFCSMMFSNNSNAFTIGYGGTTDRFRFIDGGGNEQMSIDNGGVISFQSVYGRTVGGTNRDLYIGDGGDLGYVSSVREHKMDIKSLSDASWVSDLNPVSFYRRKIKQDGTYGKTKDGSIEYGLIADEVEKVNKDFVFYDKDEDGKETLAGVEYRQLMIPMLKKIQQLETKISELETLKSK